MIVGEWALAMMLVPIPYVDFTINEKDLHLLIPHYFEKNAIQYKGANVQEGRETQCA